MNTDYMPIGLIVIYPSHFEKLRFRKNPILSFLKK